jgi:hypothetical protein
MEAFDARDINKINLIIFIHFSETAGRECSPFFLNKSKKMILNGRKPIGCILKKINRAQRDEHD